MNVFPTNEFRCSLILIQLLLIIIVGLQIFIIYALDRVTRELQVAAAIAVDELWMLKNNISWIR